MKAKWYLVFLLAAFAFAGCSSRTPQIQSESEQQVNAVPFPEEEAEEEPIRRELVMVTVGDLMVHDEQLQSAWQEDGTYDFTFTFAQVADYLSQADLCVGNLETVFGGEELGYHSFPRFNTPDSFGDALKEAGFDFVVTANNHCMDQYKPGLLRTLDVLDQLEIGHTGTFRSAGEQAAVSIQTVNGIDIAFVSLTFSTNGMPLPQGEEYLVNMIDEYTMITALERAKAAQPDWLVVHLHNGTEYAETVHPAYVDWVDRMFYYGADMVLCHHPHVLQEMEFRQVTDIYGKQREGLVIYSLGNFISSQQYEPREISIALKTRIVKENGITWLDEVSFLPTWVQFTNADGARSIRVLPIYDALQDYEAQNNLGLRPWDIDRLHRASNHITRLYLGQPVPRDEMQREYRFYQAGEPAA